MSKWVIENIELIKKTYVVEAYGEPAANADPYRIMRHIVETLSDGKEWDE